MAYRTDFSWVKDLAEFTPEEQKVLLALSHEEYKWRSRDRLLALTRMDTRELDLTLAGLIDKGLVVPSFSKNRNIVFGLKERVRA